MSLARACKALLRVGDHLVITALAVALLTFRYIPLISPNTTLTLVPHHRLEGGSAR